jgi:protein-S-isoprenylcysteine O-methyltransferase Ste14
MSRPDARCLSQQKAEGRMKWLIAAIVLVVLVVVGIFAVQYLPSRSAFAVLLGIIAATMTIPFLVDRGKRKP